MKLYKLLILFIFTISFSQCVLSQVNYSLYFPLNVGNKFYFKKVHCGPGGACDTSYIVSRILFTKVYNAKTYYYCQNYLGRGTSFDSVNYYIRYDSIAGCLVKYDTFAVSCGYEAKLFKFISLTGDSTGISCVFGDNFKCTGIFDTTIFGITVNAKKFEFSYYNNGYWRSLKNIFCRNIGPIFDYSYVATVHSSQTNIHYLKGAYINGMIYGDTCLIGINKISSNIPDKFELFQNYPNPFNPTTKIKFSIPTAGDVKLIVYDILGREIQILVSGQLQPGTYEGEFDGNNFSSGIYYYTLKTDASASLRTGYFETKKMVMIK